MKRPGFRFLMFAAMAFCLFRVCGAAAQGVLRVGPGEDVQAALDVAGPGMVVILMPGLHQGPLIVMQPLTLRGQPGAIVSGSHQGSVITVAADGAQIEALEVVDSGRDLSADDAGVLVMGNDVRVQNLRLRDNLHGIYLRKALRARVLDNEVIGLAATQKDAIARQAKQAAAHDGMHLNPPGSQSLLGNGIHLFNAHEAVVAGNRIAFVRDGIYVAHTSRAAFRGNRIHDSRYGIHYMYSHDNVIENNVLWRNVAGPALMFSHDLRVANNILRDHGGFRAYGLLLQDIERSRFEGNRILGNRVGMRLQNCNDNVFVDNRIAGNLGGLTMDTASGGNTFTRNVFGFNLHQVELAGASQVNQWSQQGVGNQWYDAMPIDLDGDGVSEWPHNEVDLIGGSRERFPALQLLTGSPGIRLLEWAIKRAPPPRLRHVTDPHPLTRSFGHDQGAAHQ